MSHRLSRFQNDSSSNIKLSNFRLGLTDRIRGCVFAVGFTNRLENSYTHDVRYTFLISILIFLNFVVCSAQDKTVQDCPKIEIETPRGFLEDGAAYHITANIHANNIEYIWTLPEGFEFTGQGTPQITFVANGELSFYLVVAKLQVRGLPPACPAKLAKEFRIQIDPGSPLEFDEYGELSNREEKFRLQYIVGQLKDSDTAVRFEIRYKPTDTKRYLRKRIKWISSVLTKEYKLSEKLFSFAFIASDIRYTAIYSSRLEPEIPDWNSAIDKLPIPER